MELITCQHEWVSHCKIKYRVDPPEGFHWENAHYPLSEKLGGMDTVLMWYPDHIVQGCLQTMEYGYPCIYTGRKKIERKILETVYPEYLGLYDQAYRVCQKYSGRRRGLAVHSRKNEEGKSIKAVELGKMMAARNHSRKDELGRSLTALKASAICHAEKNDEGKSVFAVNAARKMNSTMYQDPLHPELGTMNAGCLVQRQRARGIPHGPENRVKVYTEGQGV
jgi:hypothetical protein